MNNIVKQPMLPDTIHFHHTTNNDNTEVLRITRTGVWVNPDLSIDDTAKTVLAALDSQIKVLVQAEREACAKVVEDFARKWWKIHCDSNKHLETTLKAHQDFCALQAAIRARGKT